jgi:hypothetical protein
MDGRCVFSGGRCSEDGTDALDGDGNLVEECKPYLCINGACEDSCASSSDCQDGFLCDTVEAQCVAESDNVSTSEGCGCRLAGAGRGDPRTLAALALSIWILRRRRLRKVAA